MVEPLQVVPQRTTATNDASNDRPALSDPCLTTGPAKATQQAKRQEGTLELTILKAELTGEPLPQFTQSYVCVTCQGQTNRTPNAAQKDQHKPDWNATIRMPLTLPGTYQT